MPDRELGTLYGGEFDVRAIVREIRDPARTGSWHGTLIGLELRIELGGEMRQSQLFRDRRALDVRSQAIHDILIEKGWKRAQ
jgi:hypothetical protein